MKRFNFSSSTVAKLVTVFLLVGLMGGLGAAYTVHNKRQAVVESRAATKAKELSKAASAGQPKSTMGNRADLLTPPPAPAAQSGVIWPASPEAPASLAVNSLAVVASSTSLKAGDNITVTLYENSGDVPVNSVQARLTYDASRLELTGTVLSADFGLEAATDSSTIGVVQLARAVNGEAVTGVRAVGSLHFTVTSTATGSVSIQPDQAKSYIVRASDSANILQSVGAAQLSLQAR